MYDEMYLEVALFRYTLLTYILLNRLIKLISHLHNLNLHMY